jgi:hypothetical protein
MGGAGLARVAAGVSGRTSTHAARVARKNTASSTVERRIRPPIRAAQ